ncbi:hypothetical protein MYX07_04940 [Patescibacteria group bacterium AH-259-L07]|nr:hypothetical protein [Patescibacteria group bacterium AH-259-L07]
MKRNITVVVIIVVVWFTAWSGVMALTSFKTDVTEQEVYIQRPDIPLNFTAYRYFPNTGNEFLDQYKFFGKSMVVEANKEKGVRQVHVIKKHTVSLESDGEVTECISYDELWSCDENLPYEQFRDIFEDAEKSLQDTRERFAPIIEKELRKQ